MEIVVDVLFAIMMLLMVAVLIQQLVSAHKWNKFVEEEHKQIMKRFDNND